MTNRKHFLPVLAEAMWQLHAQEKDWGELNVVEQEQMLSEAQHCIEALQEGGYAIIAQATPEEFAAAQQKLARRQGEVLWMGLASGADQAGDK